ncbi:DUF1294 domain-containing protein [Streptococcus ruminantium]|uniref:DUF1294 domain-containing protein n=1 Tax=Streptococcus ruminantium TaxID=1917441 RepID=A0ABU1B3G1_9STRE|nr:DUF1294 domain-containing protein [Streptococcus ruminantium]MDQ8759515.1 DUF1294 domain-containing protein [Streptococcus ruminantium]MDQ8768477.1 DUF1294 domain-containing protein [Streptococcus ruminantium]MDQ8774350.1 DUF1294 domain-containing protein [Streptococcus ruminantium]MDQ8793260.1 DUF1294 domain-containing protein [Streptococcus ruminantium]MDQ8796143.1 DUF1294 domain-containing protein [Streptococcus ruminantium]
MTIKQMASMILMIWNMIVFITYGIDKGKARKSTYRISEKILLFMSYLGGGLGAWAGGTHFRHKTQKKYFQLAWAVGLMVDAVIMYWIWK